MSTGSKRSVTLKHKLVFALIVFILALLSAEGLSRLFESSWRPQETAANSGPGWQTTFFRSIFDWDEPDPDLLWRFKPNLDSRLIRTNRRGLIADNIPQHKPKGTIRIMVAGDSSPAGLGLQSRSETFADVLVRRLSLYAPDSIHLEMINASVPGYSSEQVRRFMEIDGWQYQPDLLIVYCGNNDASISGSASDHQLLEGERLRTVRRILSHSAFYRLLRGVLLAAVSRKHESASQPLVVRVSPDRYAANLRAIVREGAGRNIPVVILKPPVPLLWPAALEFNIFRSMNSPDNTPLLPPQMVAELGRELEYCLSPQIIGHIYGRADPITAAVLHSAFNDSLSPSRALTYWAERLRARPQDPVLWNNLGVSAWRTGDFAAADSLFNHALARYGAEHPGRTSPAAAAAETPFLYNRGINALSRDGIDTVDVVDRAWPAYRWLDSALQNDFYSLRVKRTYLSEIDSLTGATVIDLWPLFAAHGGERLFVDHCHPDAIGHRLIADSLLPYVVKLLHWSAGAPSSLDQKTSIGYTTPQSSHP